MVYNVKSNHSTTVLARKQAEVVNDLWLLGYNLEGIARIFNQRCGITGRKLKQVYEMTWMELKRFTLTSLLLSRLRGRKAEFDSYIQ